MGPQPKALEVASRAIPTGEAIPSTRSQDVIQTQAAAKGQVWIHGPAAAGVYIDICGLCPIRRHLEPCEIKSEDLSLALEMLALLLSGHYSKRVGPCTRERGPSLLTPGDGEPTPRARI